jgi:hypothetical protein
MYFNSDAKSWWGMTEMSFILGWIKDFLFYLIEA